MRCDECNWWDALTPEEIKAMNLNVDCREKGAGLCRLEPTSEVTCSDNRCRHFDPKPKTSDELLQKAKDITKAVGGEVPEKKSAWTLSRQLLVAIDCTITAVGNLESMRKEVAEFETKEP